MTDVEILEIEVEHSNDRGVEKLANEVRRLQKLPHVVFHEAYQRLREIPKAFAWLCDECAELVPTEFEVDLAHADRTCEACGRTSTRHLHPRSAVELAKALHDLDETLENIRQESLERSEYDE